MSFFLSLHTERCSFCSSFGASFNSLKLLLLLFFIQVRKLQAAHDAAIQKEREARASAEAEASKRAEEAASAAQAASQEADSLRSMRDEARAQLALNEAQRMAMEAEGAKQTASQAKDLEEMRNKVLFMLGALLWWWTFCLIACTVQVVSLSFFNSFTYRSFECTCI